MNVRQAFQHHDFYGAIKKIVKMILMGKDAAPGKKKMFILISA